MSIFDSLASLTSNVVKVVVTPVEMTVDLVDAAVKPIADAAKELTKDVKSIKD